MNAPKVGALAAVTATSVSPAYPAGVLTGYSVFAFVWDVDSTSAFNGGGGWTRRVAVTDAGAGLELWEKNTLYTPGDAVPVFSQPFAEGIRAVLVAQDVPQRGASAIDQLATNNLGGGTGSNVVAPSVTLAVLPAQLFGLWMNNASTSWPTPPPGWTVLTSGSGGLLAYRDVAVIGATGTTTAVASNFGKWAAITFDVIGSGGAQLIL